MEILYRFWILSFLSISRDCRGDVNLKIILQLPMATLECNITHSQENEVSAILMCPNEFMCFQNCERLCEPPICNSNNITCTYKKSGNTKSFNYVFNTSNSQNHGEWTCYYGSEKGATATFYKEGTQTNSKREVQKDKKDSVALTFENRLTSASISTSSQKTPYSIIVNPISHKTLTNVSPYYVILLLVIFSISLLINIVFLVRDMLTTISTRKAVRSSDEKKYSCWLTVCIKLFCLERILQIRQTNKTNTQLNENKSLISRQVSSNIYEHSIPFHFQTPFLWENYAYTGTPANERMSVANNFIRSKSFPVKNNDTNLYSLSPNAIKVLTNKNVPAALIDNTSTNDLANQIIYDDVAEPSIQYIPYDSPVYCSSLARPNQRLSRHISMQSKNQLAAMSMNNLNLKSKCPSDSMIGNTPDPDNEILLKDAINSRVELSKEMLNQADNLLKQADNLLNIRDSPKHS